MREPVMPGHLRSRAVTAAHPRRYAGADGDMLMLALIVFLAVAIGGAVMVIQSFARSGHGHVALVSDVDPELGPQKTRLDDSIDAK
jgi:hypothetical protein